MAVELIEFYWMGWDTKPVDTDRQTDTTNPYYLHLCSRAKNAKVQLRQKLPDSREGFPQHKHVERQR
jgi:hypothetical protein